MVTIKLSKKKAVDRIIKDMKEATTNLESINDTEVELLPDRYLKRLGLSVEMISVISDMLADMEYEQ